MLRVGRHLQQRRRARAEEQVVDDRLVLQREPRELVRQREDDVEVADRQQFRAVQQATDRSRRVWHFGQCRLRHEL